MYDYAQFFKSAVVLTATIALQGNSAQASLGGGVDGVHDVAVGRPHILRDTVKLLGPQVMDFTTPTHGAIADILLFKRAHRNGPALYGVRPNVVPPSVTRSGSAEQALFRLFRDWPHREPASIFLDLCRPHRWVVWWVAGRHGLLRTRVASVLRIGRFRRDESTTVSLIRTPSVRLLGEFCAGRLANVLTALARAAIAMTRTMQAIHHRHRTRDPYLTRSDRTARCCRPSPRRLGISAHRHQRSPFVLRPHTGHPADAVQVSTTCTLPSLFPLPS